MGILRRFVCLAAFIVLSLAAQPVQVSPAFAQLSAGQTQQYTATWSGQAQTNVVWAVASQTGGTSGIGTISSSGLYTAPAGIAASVTVIINAKSAAGSGKTAATVNPVVGVSLSPAFASLMPGNTQQFTAAVTGTTNAGVTWAVSPAVGTVSSGGLYTAPATVGGAQTVTVTAISVANQTKKATASVTVVPPVQVSVTPATASRTASQTQQFTATVTGTTNTGVTWAISPALGAISGAGLYTAPATVSSATSVTVTATSAADRSKSATATISLAPPPLAITTSALPNGMIGAAYNAQLAATGGTAPYTWSIGLSQLPAGLGVGPTSGTISGTPTTAGAYNVTMILRDSANQQISRTFSLIVAAALTITTASLPDATAGTAYSATLSASGGTAPYTWSMVSGGLPPGISLAGGGTLAGTPSTEGSYSFTIQAQDAAGRSVSKNLMASVQATQLTISVSPASASLSAGRTQQFMATVRGTANTAVTWAVSPAVGTISNGGLYTAPATLSATQVVTVTATSVANQTKKATASVTVVPPVTVSLTPTAATMLPSQGQTFTATVGGTSNTGVTWSIAPATGTISSGGLYTAPSAISSTSSVTVTATSVADATKSASAAITLIPPVQITTSSLPGGTSGAAYSTNLSATGGVAPYTWSVVSGAVPAGLSLGTSSGAIAGTPASAGSYNITVQATDSAGYQVSALFTLAIAVCSGCSRPLSITTSSLPSGMVNAPYNSTLTATGGTAPYTWSLASGQLPAGVGLNAATGAVSGTPSGPGATSFTAKATDASSPPNTASQALAVSVSAAPVTDQYGGLTSLTSPGGKIGKWSVEKYPTSDGYGRWLFTTPAGHGFWCASQFALAPPTKLNINAKYGSHLNWEKAALDRYTGWGFNCLADYTDPTLLNDMIAGHLNETIPFFTPVAEFPDYAMWRRQMTAGWGHATTLPQDAVKDLLQAAGAYTGYVASPGAADGFDPNFSTYVTNYLAADKLTNDPGYLWSISPYNVALSIGDADYTFGFGPGPDDCTSKDGSYHPHIGWLALASPTNYYANWMDASNTYNTENWIFTDTQVYAKRNLISFLKTEYANSISALNAAWGSTYSAFDSAATRYTGEMVATTDGTTATYTHNFAHTPVSRNTLAIKVDGVTLGSDPPRFRGQSPNAVGRWPDGASMMTANVIYGSGGSITIGSQQHTQSGPTITGPGTTSWGTVTLTHPNVIAGSILLWLYGPDGLSCRVADQRSTGYNWTSYPMQCSGGFTVTGTVNYTAGTIANLTITPAVSSSYTVAFIYDYNVVLPGIHTITVDYDVNGFGSGTTLADEDGSHTGWLGPTSGQLAKPGNPANLGAANVNVWTDLNNWLTTYMDAYYTSTITPIKAAYPSKLVYGAMSGVGGHGGCPRKQVAVETANYADFLTISQPLANPALGTMLGTWGITGPTMDSWEGSAAQADSPFARTGGGTWDNYTTQALRGAAMAGYINAAITSRFLGIKFWAYSDTTSENTDFGLTTPLDNAYDGHEAVTGGASCSAPINASACGGEAANYGDAVTAVRNALRAMWARISQ